MLGARLGLLLATALLSGCAGDPLEGLRFSCDPEWAGKGLPDPCGAGCACVPIEGEKVHGVCECGPDAGDPGPDPAEDPGPDPAADGSPADPGPDPSDSGDARPGPCDPDVPDACAGAIPDLGPCEKAVCAPAQRVCRAVPDEVACSCPPPDHDCSPLEDGLVCNGTLVCDRVTDPEHPRCVVAPLSVPACDAAKDTTCLRNLCTEPHGDCAMTPVREGEPCLDADSCTKGETCHDGTCQGGTTIFCDDGNPCTVDVCDPGLYCTFTNVPRVCADARCEGINFFPAAVCADGVCPEQSGRACDDGNWCTDDDCDPVLGCTHAFNTTPCGMGSCEGLLWHRPPTCDNGACDTAQDVQCDDGNDCTVDACDPDEGCSWASLVGEPCGCAGTCWEGVCDEPGESLNGADDDCDGATDEPFDLDRDGVCDSDECATRGVDACPTVWTPDNSDEPCKPIGEGWTSRQTVVLSEAGGASSSRRTNEPVEVPLATGILDDSVVGYWPLDGGTAKDVSGLGRDGTLQGTPNAAAGMDGAAAGALSFGGAACVKLPASPVTFTDTASVMAWVRVDAFPAAGTNAQVYYNGSAAGEFHLYLYGTVPTFGVMLSDNKWHEARSGTPLEADRWYHLAGVFVNDTVALFVDGTLSAFAAVPDLALKKATFSPSIGCYNGSAASQSLKGAVDDVVVLRRALWPEEVAAHHNSRRPFGTSLVPGAQADLDDVRVTEVSPQQAEHGVPFEVIGVKPHSDTPCPMQADDGTWKDRDDLCGVRAYWRLDGDAKDVTGDHDGTLNGATAARGRFGDAGGAQEFAGAQWIDAPASEGLSFDPTTHDHTVEAWFRPDTASAGGMIVIDRTGSNTPAAIQISVGSGKVTASPWDGTTNSTCESAVSTVGNWHHVAWVMKDKTGTLYLDGLPRCTIPYGGKAITGTRGVTLGRQYTCASSVLTCSSGFKNYLDGALDEVLIHSVAKSPEYVWRRARPGVPTVRFLAHTKPFANAQGRFDFLSYALQWGNPTAWAPVPVLTGLDKVTRSFGLLSAALGYVGWWRLDEGSGTVAVDASTAKRNGTVSGPVAFVAGAAGLARAFDGTTSAVTVPDDPALTLPRFTVEANVGFKGPGGTLVSKGRAGSPGTHAYEVGALLSVVSAHYVDAAANTVSVFADSPPESFAVAATRDDDTLRLFVDGSPSDETPAPATPVTNADDLLIGATLDADGLPTGHFPGLIDEVRLSSRALAADELLPRPRASWAAP